MLIEKLPTMKNKLRGKVVLITGAGGGIGLEAAKTLAYMGAKVIIAEIDKTKGKQAEAKIQNLNFDGTAIFYQVHLSKENEIRTMAKNFLDNYGCPDYIINNATIIAMGYVEEVPIEVWDKSYLVNFRAPLLLTQIFLPLMKHRNTGCIVFVPSSGAAPFMGAYEVYKTSQVELCNTLTGELDTTNVHTFAIGPGLVKTHTAMEGIKIVSEKMGMSTDAFYEMNSSHILSAEEAGCGFAVAVCNEGIYNGQEIGSIQALTDAGLYETYKDKSSTEILDENSANTILNVIKVFNEQYAGWMERNIFERQWVLRDFKKTIGISAEQFRNEINHLMSAIEQGDKTVLTSYYKFFEKLIIYYERQYTLLQRFEKNPDTLKEHSTTILQWIDELNKITGLV